MGASLLMPRRIIENALAKYNHSNPIKVYGDNTITSNDKAVIRRMAAYIGVSYTALVIRLRDMGLFEYHNILEYISNELNLGGVSPVSYTHLLLQIWILFLFALMKKTVRIRNLYCIRKDENREK